jgi:ECF transporter S component (folate family)
MPKFKFNIIAKISLSALFCAFTIILTKLLSIQNIASLPFIRISLGPTMVTFSGILLGPIYGGIIGFLSDLLGYFMFDTTGFAYNPLLSLTYLAYGVLGGSFVYLFRLNKKIKFPIVQLISLLFINIFVITFFSLNDKLILYGKTYNLNGALKVGLIIGPLLVSIIYFFVYFLISKTIKEEKNKVLLNNISSIVLITFALTQLGLGVIIKSVMFEVDYLFLFASQVIATSIEILIGTYTILILYVALMRNFGKYIVVEDLKEKKADEKVQ